MPKHLNFPDLIDIGAPFSNVVVDDRYAFLAGIVAADMPEGRDALGDVGDETRSVLTTIRALLGRLGLDMSDIVRCDVHLTDLDQMDEMNAVYAGFFGAGAFPARTCVQSDKLFGGSLVEVTCVARLREGTTA